MRRIFYLLLLCLLLFFPAKGFSQKFSSPVIIPLDSSINSVNEEFSGLAIYGDRLFLLPQYGDALKQNGANERNAVLDRQLVLYSYPLAELGHALDQRSALGKPETVLIKNLELLPDSVKGNFQGFEALCFANKEAYFSIETADSADYCYIIKGRFSPDTRQIEIDPFNFLALKRFPYIPNAGFESLTYLPAKKKLLAMYEFNGVYALQNCYLIDRDLRKQPKVINPPQQYFRITDITTSSKGKIYGLNYYYPGDYNDYLNNNLIRHEEKNIQRSIPALKDSLAGNREYLKLRNSCYAAIVETNKRFVSRRCRAGKWRPIVQFEGRCSGNNWEGIALFRNGAFVISDGNRNKRQVTSLAYVEF